MSAAGRTPVRPLAVGGVVGLVLGLLIGLLIGWGLWPVEYQQAYSYQLVDEEKTGYVAAVADAYNLTGQIATAQQRFATWTPEEQLTALSKAFADYQVQGKMQEAERIADLVAELQRSGGWDPALVSQVTTDLATQYAGGGEADKAQAVALLAAELGTQPPVVTPSTAESPAAQGGSLGSVLRICGVLILVAGVVALALVLLRQRRPAQRKAVEREARTEPLVPGGPLPLLQKSSTYNLGMDNYDESFAIEADDGEWLGECGMGISESLDGGAPRRVVAFEVWLFDKPNTRTVTKVLMSDFANSNEALRNKLSARGDPVLATPGGTFTLETPALTVKAQVVEMEYGEGMPAFGYFKHMKVAVTAYRKPEAGQAAI